MTNKVKVALAAIIITLGGIAGGISGADAHASIGDCSATRSGNTESATCYSVTAGGSQHVRAWISCAYGIFQTRQTFYGPTVGVLATSTVTCSSGGYGAYGGYQLRA